MTKKIDEAAAWVEYEQIANQARAALQQMTEGLKRYAEREGAKPEWIDSRARAIRSVYTFMVAADQLLKEADANNRAHYLRGLQQGRKEAQRADRSPYAHLAKEGTGLAREAHRQYIIAQAKNDFPDLF